MNLSTHDWGLIALGGVLVAIIGTLAYRSTPDQLVGEIQTEAQFSGLSLDTGLRTNIDTNVSLDPLAHFYHPGLDPEPGAQKLRTLPIRYPLVSGGNASTVIHRGFSAMSEGSPDNCWRTFPPSEDNI